MALLRPQNTPFSCGNGGHGGSSALGAAAAGTAVAAPLPPFSSAAQFHNARDAHIGGVACSASKQILERMTARRAALRLRVFPSSIRHHQSAARHL